VVPAQDKRSQSIAKKALDFITQVDRDVLIAGMSLSFYPPGAGCQASAWISDGHIQQIELDSIRRPNLIIRSAPFPIRLSDMHTIHVETGSSGTVVEYKCIRSHLAIPPQCLF
jgi:hypothetical protein